MNNTLPMIIQSLSILLIGGVSWFLRELMKDVKTMRNELTVLQTEHAMLKESGHCPLMWKHEHNA